MATGDPIGFCYQFIQPATNFASFDTTAAPYPVYDFDDGVDEKIYALGFMTGNYDGTSDITVLLPWKFTTFVGSQTCDWEVSFYRVADDLDSIDSYTFAAAQTLIASEASATGELDYASITFTNAQADGIQPNEYFVLQILRDASGGTQGSPGDTELGMPIPELA